MYLNGLPFTHFEQNPDGSLTNLQMTISDIHSNPKVYLVDRDVDGEN